MRIAILAAGAVGSALGSLLWRAGEDVVLVGRAAPVAAIRAAGIAVEGVLGGFDATPHAEERLTRKPELALLAVKIVLALLRRVADGGRFLTAREIERAFEREFGPRPSAKQAA